jgi:hypothetical protein
MYPTSSFFNSDILKNNSNVTTRSWQEHNPLILIHPDFTSVTCTRSIVSVNICVGLVPCTFIICICLHIHPHTQDTAQSHHHKIIQANLLLPHIPEPLKPPIWSPFLYFYHFNSVVYLSAVAYACNPSYSGGRDWEDHISRPAWVKSSWDHISTNKTWVW